MAYYFNRFSLSFFYHLVLVFTLYIFVNLEVGPKIAKKHDAYPLINLRYSKFHEHVNGDVAVNSKILPRYKT